MICFSVNIHLSFAISLPNPVFSVPFSTVSELFCDELLEVFVILSAFFLTIKWPVASAVLRITPFESVLSASVVD